MSDQIFCFAPFSVIVLLGTFLMNRYGWTLTRALLCVLLSFLFISIEVATSFRGVHLALPFATYFSLGMLGSAIFLLPPIVLLFTAGGLCFLLGRNPTYVIYVSLALYVTADLWIVHWIRASKTS